MGIFSYMGDQMTIEMILILGGLVSIGGSLFAGKCAGIFEGIGDEC